MKEEKGKKALPMLLVAAISLSMVTALTPTTKAPTEEEIKDAIELGVAFLAWEQNTDGSWGLDDIVKIARARFHSFSISPGPCSLLF